jgi:hypothetical protein
MGGSEMKADDIFLSDGKLCKVVGKSHYGSNPVLVYSEVASGKLLVGDVEKTEACPVLESLYADEDQLRCEFLSIMFTPAADTCERHCEKRALKQGVCTIGKFKPVPKANAPKPFKKAAPPVAAPLVAATVETTVIEETTADEIEDAEPANGDLF